LSYNFPLLAESERIAREKGGRENSAIPDKTFFICFHQGTTGQGNRKRGEREGGEGEKEEGDEACL